MESKKKTATAKSNEKTKSKNSSPAVAQPQQSMSLSTLSTLDQALIVKKKSGTQTPNSSNLTKTAKDVTKPTDTTQKTTTTAKKPSKVPLNYDHVTALLIKQGKLVGRNYGVIEVPPTSEARALQLRPFDELRPEDRLDLAELASAPNSIQNGRYLLCQTITFATLDVSVLTVITDPKGDVAMPLGLYSYAFGENLVEWEVDDVLPPGSFLVLKNPSLTRMGNGHLLLYSKNPAEVELVSKKWMDTKFPDVEWEGDIAEWTLKFSKKRSIWKEFEGDEAAFGKLKELGHKGVSDGRFSNAIRFYDMALDYVGENRQDEAVIQSNKAAALMGLGCYNAALKCAEAALEINPGHQKYNSNKTKALVALVRYEEAENFLEKQFQHFPSLSINENCKTLLEGVKFLASRKSLGPTEPQRLSIRLATLKRGEVIPEFTGPLAVVLFEGKGRGYVATEDIHPGQLLVCEMALVFKSMDPNRPGNIMDQLTIKTANMLTFDPELRPVFYNLTAGRDHGHLKSDDPSVRLVDMTRIGNTLKANAFSLVGVNAQMGLWAVCSLFNHNCSEHNCVWDFSGKFMTVRAIAEIKQGDELKLAYQSPIFSYEHRNVYFKANAFSCNCKLCQLEAAEPVSVRQERTEILKSLSQLSSDSSPIKIEKALEEMEKLILLRKDSIALNFPLLSPEVFALMRILMKASRHGDALPFLNQMFDVAAASNCCFSEGIVLSIHVISCYAATGDKESALVWIATLKKLIIKYDGYLEAMRSIGGATVNQLKQKFDIDFFEDE